MALLQVLSHRTLLLQWFFQLKLNQNYWFGANSDDSGSVIKRWLSVSLMNSFHSGEKMMFCEFTSDKICCIVNAACIFIISVYMYVLYCLQKTI